MRPAFVARARGPQAAEISSGLRGVFGCRFAGHASRSEAAHLAIVHFEDMRAFRQLHDEGRIREGRTKIHVEEFQRSLNFEEATS